MSQLRKRSAGEDQKLPAGHRTISASEQHRRSISPLMSEDRSATHLDNWNKRHS